MTEKQLNAKAIEYMECLGIDKKCVNCAHCQFELMGNRKCVIKDERLNPYPIACDRWMPNDNLKIVAAKITTSELDFGTLDTFKSNSNSKNNNGKDLAKTSITQELLRNERLRNEKRPDLNTWRSEMSTLKARLQSLKDELAELEERAEGIRRAKHNNDNDKLLHVYIQMERDANEQILCKQEDIELAEKAIKDKQWERDKWEFWVPDAPKQKEPEFVRPATMQEVVDKELSMAEILMACDGVRFAQQPELIYRRKGMNGRIYNATRDTATITINKAHSTYFDAATEHEAVAFLMSRPERLRKKYAESMINAFTALLSCDMEVDAILIKKRQAKLEYWRKEAGV